MKKLLLNFFIWNVLIINYINVNSKNKKPPVVDNKINKKENTKTFKMNIHINKMRHTINHPINLITRFCDINKDLIISILKFLERKNIYKSDNKLPLYNINFIHNNYKNSLDPLFIMVLDKNYLVLKNIYAKKLMKQKKNIILNNQLIDAINEDLIDDYDFLKNNLLFHLYKNAVYQEINLLSFIDEKTNQVLNINIKNLYDDKWEHFFLISQWEYFFKKPIFIIKKHMNNPEVKKCFQFLDLNSYFENITQLLFQYYEINYLYIVKKILVDQNLLLKTIKEFQLNIDTIKEMENYIIDFRWTFQLIFNSYGDFIMPVIHILLIDGIIKENQLVGDVISNLSLIIKNKHLLKNITSVDPKILEKYIDKYYTLFNKFFENLLMVQKICIEKYSGLLNNIKNHNIKISDDFILSIEKLINKTLIQNYILLFLCGFGKYEQNNINDFSELFTMETHINKSNNEKQDCFIYKYDYINTYLLLKEKYDNNLLKERISCLNFNEYLINQKQLLSLLNEFYIMKMTNFQNLI